jgi:HK97 family phage major capsid protein
MDTKAISALFQEHTDQVRTILEKANQKLAETDARLFDLEQKSVRGGGGGSDSSPKSLGAKFIEQDGVKDFAHRNARHDRFQFETKATLTSSTSNAAGSVGAGIQAFRDPAIVPLPQRRPVIRSLLPVVQMTGGSVEVVSIAGRANNSMMVAEGARKPESDVRLELKTVPARVLAHYMKASRQVLDDLPQLEGLINNELLEGLSIREEQQILHGDGVGQNLLGLLPQATAYAPPITPAGTTPLDVIGLAILQTALAEHPATGIIMNPADWMRICLLRDGDGNFIMGGPGTAIEQRLFSIPVVTTTAIAVDSFLVGNFFNAATLYDRWQARIEIGTTEDDFVTNRLTLLCEERIALHTKDSTALVRGDFGFVS